MEPGTTRSPRSCLDDLVVGQFVKVIVHGQDSRVEDIKIGDKAWAVVRTEGDKTTLMDLMATQQVTDCDRKRCRRGAQPAGIAVSGPSP